jgi:hypothetical protein
MFLSLNVPILTVESFLHCLVRRSFGGGAQSGAALKRVNTVSDKLDYVQ